MMKIQNTILYSAYYYSIVVHAIDFENCAREKPSGKVVAVCVLYAHAVSAVRMNGMIVKNGRKNFPR